MYLFSYVGILAQAGDLVNSKYKIYSLFLQILHLKCKKLAVLMNKYEFLCMFCIFTRVDLQYCNYPSLMLY